LIKAAPEKNQIIVARVTDSLGNPAVDHPDGYPDYQILFKQPLELRGIDNVELRVLDTDTANKTIRACFHAVAKFNPQVSNARAILLTYISMKNTAYQVIRELFS
jgi:hypothetical protein